MSYEIDFIGVGAEVKQNADAICFRWLDGTTYWNTPVYKVGIFNGGFEAHGKRMVEHINYYYFNSSESSEKVIDFIFISHNHQDHTVGIKNILENFKVKGLYMNRPWLYVDELWYKVSDGRITKDSLYRRLRENYKNIADIEDLALAKGIPIFEAFQGMNIERKLLILSPSKQFYIDLIVESEKALFNENRSTLSMLFADSYKVLKKYFFSLFETWKNEHLRENVETSPENETSIILHENINRDGFLLVGDAGVRALNQAMDYLEYSMEDIRYSVQLYQIPHHGSRHNINPSTLNRMVGPILAEGETKNCYAIASVTENSDHPLKIVVNAYVRRGARVPNMNGITFWYHTGNMPDRLYNTVKYFRLSNWVEAYEE